VTPAVAKPLSDTDKQQLEAVAKEKWESARTRLVLNRPFFASLALARPPVVDWTCKTAWTDGRRFGYNPSFVAGLEDDQVVGLNVHEVWHVALKHHLRRGDRDKEDWNWWTDACINRLCVQDDFELPPDGVEPWGTDESAEEIFKPRPKNPKGGGGGGVECRDFQNDDGSEPTDAQKDIEDQEVSEAVTRAVNVARMAGKLPAGMDRAVEAAQPQVPWKELLAEFLSQFAKNDYSWLHPDRRMVGAGFIFPGLFSEEQGKICFTGDTSGSQSQEDLRKIAGELLWQCEQLAGDETDLAVCWWDTDIYVQRISSAEDIKPRGGGGTDAAKMFEWVAGRLQAKDEQGELVEAGECLACVVMTDGELGGFGNDPGIPVLWILTRPNRAFNPPFGRVAWTFE
jgi:predicted metal-dependent peptidase